MKTLPATHNSRPSATVMAALGAEPTTLELLPGLIGGAWLLQTSRGADRVLTAADAVHAEAAQVAAECNVGPRVFDYVDGWLVSERLVGTHLTSLELRRPVVLRDLAALLVRMHASPMALPVVPMIDSRQQYAAAAGDRVPPMVLRAIEWADEVERDLETATDRWVPAHLDVVANVLLTDRGLRLIDFEYARSAPPARELGQVIWEGELDRRAADRLVSNYQAGAGLGDAQVAAAATWCALSAITWTVWALARPGPEMQQYARRSWERLASHWARPPGL